MKVAEHYQTPAARVVAQLGGVKKVAALAGRNPASVYRWMMLKSAGGTGGLIPNPSAAALMEAAKREGLALSWLDFAAREGEVCDA
jgi:hypothetical protein